MGFLSRWLFFFSSLTILPPPRARQIQILRHVEEKNLSSNEFLKNSLCQYDCHGHYFLKSLWLAYSIVSFFVFPILFIFLVMRGFLKIKKTNRQSAIVLYPKVPAVIAKRYGPLFVKKPFGRLVARDYKYCLTILLNSGFRPYFILRSIWKLAVYSELFETYRPKHILVTQEMVFESSLLTNYLRNLSVEHINFMHGDKHFSIQDAYSSFSVAYVWEEYYAELFDSLKCSNAKYDFFPALDRLVSDLKEKNIIKYYHQESPNPEFFSKILSNLLIFSKEKSCDPVIRLHPHHVKPYEREMAKRYGIEIEPNSVELTDSLAEARYVCSEFSSVLYQASLMNKALVVDNTFPERMKILKDLDLIFLKKLKHTYLVNS